MSEFKVGDRVWHIHKGKLKRFNVVAVYTSILNENKVDLDMGGRSPRTVDRDTCAPVTDERAPQVLTPMDEPPPRCDDHEGQFSICAIVYFEVNLLPLICWYDFIDKIWKSEIYIQSPRLPPHPRVQATRMKVFCRRCGRRFKITNTKHTFLCPSCRKKGT